MRLQVRQQSFYIRNCSSLDCYSKSICAHTHAHTHTHAHAHTHVHTLLHSAQTATQLLTLYGLYTLYIVNTTLQSCLLVPQGPPNIITTRSFIVATVINK